MLVFVEFNIKNNQHLISEYSLLPDPTNIYHLNTDKFRV